MIRETKKVVTGISAGFGGPRDRGGSGSPCPMADSLGFLEGYGANSRLFVGRNGALYGSREPAYSQVHPENQRSVHVDLRAGSHSRESRRWPRVL